VTIGTGRLLREGTVSHIGSRTAVTPRPAHRPDGKLYAGAASSYLILRPEQLQVPFSGT